MYICYTHVYMYVNPKTHIYMPKTIPIKKEIKLLYILYTYIMCVHTQTHMNQYQKGKTATYYICIYM